MTYVIIETGGRQYKVQKNDIINIELLSDKKKGDEVVFDKVLLLNTGTDVKLGTPYIKDCIVKGTILDEVKGPKVIAYKYKKRKNYHRKVGHRQKYFKIQITENHGS